MQRSVAQLHKRTLCTLALCLVAVSPAIAQDGERGQGRGRSAPDIDYEAAHLSKVVRAVRTTDRIVVDGHLDEAAWELAPPAPDLLQKPPLPNRPASEPTEVRFLYDSENLYIGVMCFDSDMSCIAVNDLQ